MTRNSTQRFSDRVDNYIKYRPDYPQAVVEFMTAELGLTKNSTVVDVGSGTGISAELFLKNGNTVYGVEPNDPMREAAERLLGGYTKFHSVKGTSEATGLPGAIADFIVAAQAFHWFEPVATKAEFARILKPHGVVLLIWNDRKTEGSEFSEAYEALIREFAIDYEQVNHKNVDEARIAGVLRAHGLRCFYHFQELDFSGLLGRLASSSYMPNENHPRFAEMASALKDLFEKYRNGGQVRIEYDTRVYYSVKFSLKRGENGLAR